MYTLEARPGGPPPPTTILLRNRKGFPKVVVAEDEAFEMYLALREYFEGKCEHAAAEPDPEAKS